MLFYNNDFRLTAIIIVGKWPNKLLEASGDQIKNCFEERLWQPDEDQNEQRQQNAAKKKQFWKCRNPLLSSCSPLMYRHWSIRFSQSVSFATLQFQNKMHWSSDSVRKLWQVKVIKGLIEKVQLSWFDVVLKHGWGYFFILDVMIK